MFKKNFILPLACLILLIFANATFADPIVSNSRVVITGGTVTDLGSTFNTLDYTSTSSDGAESGAIDISGNATVTSSSGFTKLIVSANPNIFTFRHGISVKEASLTITADKFAIENNNNSGSAINASNGGTLVFKGELEVTQIGESAPAIVIIGSDSSAIFLKPVAIITNETYNKGIHLNQGATIDFKDTLTITTKEEYSQGVRVDTDDCNFNVYKKTDITIEAADSFGLYLTSKSKINFYDDLTINTKANYSPGIYTEGGSAAGATIKIDGNVNITTKGTSASSIRPSHGIHLSASADYMSSSITINGDTTINTSGSAAFGIFIANYNTATFKGTTVIKTTGDSGSYGSTNSGSTGVRADIATVTFDGPTTIITEGVKSYGISATSVTGYSVSTITFNDTLSLTTKNAGSAGVVIGTNSKVVFNGYTDISTEGNNAYGVYIGNTGSVDFTNGGKIVTKGDGADGIVFVSTTASSFKSLYVKSEKNLTLSNNTNGDIEAAFTGSSEIHGYIGNYQVSSAYGTFLLKLSDDSFWKGTTASPGYGEVNIELNDNAAWQIAEDSYVDSLKMSSDSSVSFLHQSAGTFYTAAISDLSGSGILSLNVDMSLSGTGDFLDINNASGTYKLKIADHTTGRGDAERLTIISVANLTGSLDISLDAGEKIRLGSYNYLLEATNDLLTWDLVRTGINEDVVKGAETSAIGLTEFAKSIDSTLSDELISHKRDLWAIAKYTRQNFKNLPTDVDLKQNIYNIITGADIYTYKGLTYGLFIGLNIGNHNVGTIMEADLVSFTVGTRAVYNKDNLDLSGYIRSSYYCYTLDMTDAPNELFGTATTYGISASIQALNKFYLADKFYLAPKIKATYTYISAFSHDFGPFEMLYSNSHNLVTWLGAKVGGDIESQRGILKLYSEVGWIYDFNPEIKISIEEETSISLAKNHLEVGLGADFETAEQTSFCFEVKSSFSKNMIEPIKIKLSAAMEF